MSSRRNDKESRLRMDGRAGRNRAATPPKRPELEKMMMKARSRDAATQSSYWNKKLLQAEERDPNRWRHSGYKELYESDTKVKHRSRSRSRVTKPRARSPPRERSKERRRPHTPQPTSSKNKVLRVSSSRSLSSCSDKSCSVCSPRPKQTASSSSKKKRPPTPQRSRSRSFSVPRVRKRRDDGSPPRDPRPKPVVQPSKSASHAVPRKAPRKRVKASPPRRASPLRRPSPSSSSSSSSLESTSAPPKLTLSERFGKMAQWSVDRRDLLGVSNMRITKHETGSDVKVVVQEPRQGMPVNDHRTGAGFYPETLHSAPTGLEAWDDVRVRYKYYKQRGYLRDLTLHDYMKWEEWWYKYQEWLENERCYEQWQELRHQQANSGTSKFYRNKRRGRRRDIQQ